MRTKEFLGQLDHDRIVSAIKTAETTTSGQIRVFVQRGELAGDPVVAAQEKFRKLRMEATHERNGVLIFVQPRARKFAVIGDEGVHQKCGNEFWEQLVERMRTHFQREHFTDALVEAIDETGKLLARHFPRTATAQNELPDEIIEG
ncbi:MAG: TPM domain-containing protein [Verrucomicrobiota bacterium]|nr:TPM domain-containing protein [Verrucomicrobiota bacterium]